ncbi:adenine-specific methyltransferase EcoRI family protein [bacterium]|nr:adenine-specific methyltransferase EcoRI family protein [bacterium]
MPKRNDTLTQARSDKNDEFYTLYEDIQREVNAYLEYDPNTFKDKVVLLPCDDPEWSNFTRFFAQNFETLGLKKLISTSYATESKNKYAAGYQFSIEDFLTDYEKKSPQFDKAISPARGKIFVLERDINESGKRDLGDLEWKYLIGDGDFRSEEVKALRDEADIIVTNPPFSLFREFVAWIMEANKKCLIIGNINCITYKEFFPLIKENRIWTGCRFNKRINGRNMMFTVPDSYPSSGTEIITDDSGKRYISVAGTGWYTNLEHGRRHQPIPLMSMADNLKFSKHKEILEKGYPKYVNYDAIEVSYSDAIPCDYDGLMGVPISFLNMYCPEQFEIVGISLELADDMKNYANKGEYMTGGKRFYLAEENGKYKYRRMYDRIVIRRVNE